MRRLNFFSILYLITATTFATVGFTRSNLEALLTAEFALLCALLSLFPWWRQVIISMGKKGNFIFDAVSIFIALAIQTYGLLTQSFGISYLLMGFVIVMLISTVEDAIVLKNAERVSTNQYPL